MSTVMAGQKEEQSSDPAACNRCVPGLIHAEFFAVQNGTASRISASTSVSPTRSIPPVLCAYYPLHYYL